MIAMKKIVALLFILFFGMLYFGKESYFTPLIVWNERIGFLLLTSIGFCLVTVMISLLTSLKIQQYVLVLCALLCSWLSFLSITHFIFLIAIPYGSDLNHRQIPELVASFVTSVVVLCVVVLSVRGFQKPTN